MKTGASEAFARVPTQLMTMLHCLPDYLIFSDMEQNIGGQQIHDSLATVLSEAQEGNSDFDLYRRQKACLVDQENCNKQGDPSKEGWSLDKYKNIHMAEKAYAMRPGYDWYLFVDADSYVLWSNMVQWLGRLDPTEKLYLGSETLINGFSFAHGGSGYVISKAAMQALAGEHAGVANEYDVRAKNECCGDYLFAVALKNKTEVGVKNTVRSTVFLLLIISLGRQVSYIPCPLFGDDAALRPIKNGSCVPRLRRGSKADTEPNSQPSHTHTTLPPMLTPISQWPTINGEKPSTLPFGPSHWCQPIVTMHHMNSEEINTFWHFERRRQLALAESSNLPPSHQPPLLLRDIYAAFLAPHLNATRDDWDNDAERTFYLPPPSSPNDKKEWPDWQVERTKKPEDMNALERKAHESFAACGAACKSLAGEECFRYRYRDGVCSTGNAFVMGRPVKKEEGAKRVMSGWDVEKIHAWVEGREACGKVNWPAVKKGR